MIDNELTADEQMPEPPVEVDFTTTKRWRLIWLLGLSVIVGVLEELFAEADLEREFTVGGSIMALCLTVSWCRIDAHQRGFTIRKPLLLTIVLLAGIGLPIYFIRTRGVRGIASIGLALMFLAAMFVLEQVAIEITWRLV